MLQRTFGKNCKRQSRIKPNKIKKVACTFVCQTSSIVVLSSFARRPRSWRSGIKSRTILWWSSRWLFVSENSKRSLNPMQYVVCSDSSRLLWNYSRCRIWTSKAKRQRVITGILWVSETSGYPSFTAWWLSLTRYTPSLSMSISYLPSFTNGLHAWPSGIQSFPEHSCPSPFAPL